MKTRLRDYLLSPLIWLQIFLVFLLLTLLVLAVTPIGPLLAAWAGNAFIKELTVSGVRGSVLTEITVESARWEDNDEYVASDVVIDVAMPSLSKRLLDLEALNIGELSIDLQKTPGRKRGDPMFLGDFGIDPLNVRLQQATIKRLEIKEADEPLLLLTDVTLDGTTVQNDKLALSGASAKLALEPTPVQLTISSGALDMLEPHAVDINATLGWSEQRLGQLSSQVSIIGDLKDYVITTRGEVDHPTVGKQQFSVDGTGDFDLVKVSSLAVSGDGGKLNGAGEFAWVPDLSLFINAKSDGLKTEQLAPEWPAELTGEFKVSGQLKDGQVLGGVDIKTLSGELRGYPLSGSGSLSLQQDELRFNDLAINTAGGKLKVDGLASEPYDLSWDISGDDVSRLFPGLKGQVAAKGTLSGSPDKPVINGSLRGSGLVFEGQELERADVKISTAANGKVELDGTLRGLLVQGERISRATLKGSGTISDHKMRIALDHAQANVDALLDGGWNGREWQGSVTGADIRNTRFGNFALAKPASVTVSKDGFNASEFCLRSGNGATCTTVQHSQKDGLSASGSLENTPLQLLNPWLPEGTALSGRVAGKYAVALNPDTSGDVDLLFAPGAVAFQQDSRQRRISYRSGRLKSTVNNGRLIADLEFALTEGGTVALKTDMPSAMPDSGQPPINASGSFKQLPTELVQPFLPEELSIAGLVDGEFVVQQTDQDRRGKLKLSSNRLNATYRDKVAGPQQYKLKRLEIDAELENDFVIADVQAVLQDGGSLKSKLSANLSKLKDDPLRAIAAQGSVNKLSTSLVKPYLPERFAINGELSGEYRLIQEAGEPVGEADLTLGKSEVRYQPERGRVERYRLSGARLKGTVRGEILSGDIELGLADGGGLSSQATIDLSNPDLTKAINAKGKVNRLPIALLQPYLPPELELTGALSGDYRISQKNGSTIGEVDLSSSRGVFGYQPAGNSPLSYRYETARVIGTIVDKKVDGTVALQLRDGGVLKSRAKLDLAAPNILDAMVAEGELEKMPLSLVQPFLPEAFETSGFVSGRWTMLEQRPRRGTASLRFSPGRLRYRDPALGRLNYEYTAAAVDATINGDVVSSDLSLTLRDGGKLISSNTLNVNKPKALYDLTGEGQLENLPLTLVGPWLPKNIALDGFASGRYRLTDVNRRRGALAMELKNGTLTMRKPNGEEQRIPYASGIIDGKLNGSRAEADIAVRLKDGGGLTSVAKVQLDRSNKVQSLSAEGSLDKLPIVLFEEFLPEDFSFPGKVSGSYQVEQQGERRSGSVRLSLPNSAFSMLTETGDRQRFPYENGIINATVRDNKIQLDADLGFKYRGDLRARAQIVLPKKGEPQINGMAEINIPNINWAQSYVPYSRGLRGQMVGQLSFAGSVSKPRVVGLVDIRNGYLFLPQVGNEISDINIRIEASRANQATISGSMRSGGGIISANGNLSFKDPSSWQASLNLRGDTIKFVDTHEALAFMTPNLQVNANPQAVAITGTIDIPKADINLRDLPEFSISESEDAVVIGEKPRGSEFASIRLRPNIAIRLGREIYFNGFGFSTRLAGGLRLLNSRNTIVADGALDILQGRYLAYGQDLRIDNGRLIFNGPPTNVGVDVRAVREIPDGQVGIQLNGTMQKLRSVIFSNPAIEETEALSYLLTGNSLSTATGRETALLMQAVRGFGIAGGESLTQRLGRSIGLDDLSIVTRDDFRESELQLGKRLGSKMYVRYLMGIFDSAHRLAVDYKINKYLSVEMQAGEEQSIDFSYEFETD